MKQLFSLTLFFISLCFYSCIFSVNSDKYPIKPECSTLHPDAKISPSTNKFDVRNNIMSLCDSLIKNCGLEINTDHIPTNDADDLVKFADNVLTYNHCGDSINISLNNGAFSGVNTLQVKHSDTFFTGETLESSTPNSDGMYRYIAMVYYRFNLTLNNDTSCSQGLFYASPNSTIFSPELLNIQD